MEEEQTQKSKLFQILINLYKEDLETKEAKDKKEEILDLFSNSNNFRSEEEIEEIEQKLHYACQRGDIELIKICLSETIEIDSKRLTFKIDKTNQTASLF